MRLLGHHVTFIRWSCRKGVSLAITIYGLLPLLFKIHRSCYRFRFSALMNDIS